MPNKNLPDKRGPVLPGRRRKDKSRRSVATQSNLSAQRDNELAAIAEDCERDMYGDDYDYLKDSGWLDR